MALIYLFGFFIADLSLMTFFFHLTWKISFKILRKKWLSASLAIAAYFVVAFIMRWLSILDPTVQEKLLEGLIQMQEKYSLSFVHLGLIQLMLCLILGIVYWREPRTVS